MNKPIDRYDWDEHEGIDCHNEGDYVKYEDHQELLQGLLRELLSKKVDIDNFNIGVLDKDIIKIFKKVGIE